MPDKDKIITPQSDKDVTVTSSDTPNKKPQPKEYGGPKGKEPTRYGDWERKGRCIDF